MEAGAATFMTFKRNSADLEELGDRAMSITITSAGLLLLMFFTATVEGKEWRGLTPLKSTRADVERLLGKPNELGRYEIQNERVTISYSEGPCASPYGALAKANCECLVAKDTVLKIAITLDSPVKLSKLGIDKKKFQRTPIYAYRPTATYSDFTDGVVYTILERDDAVTNIDYLPSANDCEEIVRSQTTAAAANGWQGIVPLRSDRADVERLLGPPSGSLGDIYRYDTHENRVDISYSSDPCKVGGTTSRATAADVVSKITVSPKSTLLVRTLGLDKNYTRIQNDHPESWVHYLNSGDGITVDAILNNGCEEVLSIIYQPTPRDRELRCGPNQKRESKKP